MNEIFDKILPYEAFRGFYQKISNDSPLWKYKIYTMYKESA